MTNLTFAPAGAAQLKEKAINISEALRLWLQQKVVAVPVMNRIVVNSSTYAWVPHTSQRQTAFQVDLRFDGSHGELGLFDWTVMYGAHEFPTGAYLASVAKQFQDAVQTRDIVFNGLEWSVFLRETVKEESRGGHFYPAEQKFSIRAGRPENSEPSNSFTSAYRQELNQIERAEANENGGDMTWHSLYRRLDRELPKRRFNKRRPRD